MKKLTKLLSVFVIAGALGTGVSLASGCSHQHTFSEDWSADENQHWHAATCEHTDQKSEAGDHVDENGDLICDVCEYDLAKHVTGVTLNVTSKTLTVGDEFTLTATVTPADANNKNVTWTTSAATVATVDQSGKVTAVAAGTATITVTTADGSFTATCSVKVESSVSPEPEEEYTITFDLNGHGAAIAAVETVDGKISAPTAPTDADYDFGGWYETAACEGEAIDFATKVFTQDTIVYAKWTAKTVTPEPEEEYTITFDLNGHGAAIAAVETVDGKISAPTAPTDADYDFGGWYETAACEGEAIDFATKVFTQDTTVYAKWTAKQLTETEWRTAIQSTETDTNHTLILTVTNEGGTMTATLKIDGANGVIQEICSASTGSVEYYYVYDAASGKAYFHEYIAENAKWVKSEYTREDGTGFANFAELAVEVSEGYYGEWFDGLLSLNYATDVSFDAQQNVYSTTFGGVAFQLTFANGKMSGGSATGVSLAYSAYGTTTVTLSDDVKNATLVVDVSVDLAETSYMLGVGDSVAVQYTTDPQDAVLVWDSDDKNVATVDATGKITAVGIGTATITVRGENSLNQTEISVSVLSAYDLLSYKGYENDNLLIQDSCEVGSDVTVTLPVAIANDYLQSGIYSEVNDENAYFYYVYDAATQNGKLVQKTNGANYGMYVKFGAVSGDIEGYFEVTPNDMGSSWKIIQFRNGNNTVFTVSSKSKDAAFVYTVGSTEGTPLSSVIASANTQYNVYYKLAWNADTETYSLTMTINGQAFVTDLDLGTNNIDNIYLVSSNSGARTLTVDNVVVLAHSMTAAEYAPVVLAQLQSVYGTYILQDVLDENEQVVTAATHSINADEINAIYNQAIADINAEAASEEATLFDLINIYNTAVADLASVMSDEQVKAKREAALTEIQTYVDSANYTLTENATLYSDAIADYSAQINAAKNADAVDAIVAAAKEALDEIPTDAEVTAAKLAAAQSSAKTDIAAYRAEDIQALTDETVKSNIAALVSTAQTDIDSATTVEEVASVLADAKGKIDLQIASGNLDAYKTAASGNLDGYADGIVANYDTTDDATLIANIANAVTAGKSAIGDATDNAGVDQALANAKAAIDDLVAADTFDKYVAQQQAALQTYADGIVAKYDETDDATLIANIANEVTTGKSAIGDATDNAGVDQALANAKAAIDELVAADDLAKAKTAAKEELSEYAQAQLATLVNRTESVTASVDEEVSKGSDNIDNATAIETENEVKGVTDLLADAKAAVDAVIADFKATKYTVTFVGAGIAPMQVTYGNAIVSVDESALADDEMAEGYYTDATYETAFDLTAPVYADTQIYVKVVAAVKASEQFSFNWDDIDKTLADQIALTDADLVGANAFLKVGTAADASVKYRTATDTSLSATGGVIQIAGDALVVTFKGTGTLTVGVRSTGNTAISAFALKNAAGEYVAATSGVTGDLTKTENADIYTVTGKTYLTVTFTITKAGEYTLCQLSTVEGLSGLATALRVDSVVQTDTYKLPKIGVESVEITGGTRVAIGDTLALTATVAPENASFKTVTWTSSDESVATVDENGVVTGVAAGLAVITATADSVSQTVTVEVGDFNATVQAAIAQIATDYPAANYTQESNKSDYENAVNGATAEYSATTSLTALNAAIAKWDAVFDEILTDADLSKNLYTVTFYNGSETFKSLNVVENETVSAPADEPSKEGFLFNGWFSDAECTTPFDFESAITANTNVYAGFLEIFTVTFYDGETALDAVSVTDGGKVAEPENDPVKDGYIFGGWYADEACETEFDFENTAIVSATAVYAKWIEAYTVTWYDVINGVATVAGTEQIEKTAALTQPANPVMSGYNFGGWYQEESLTNVFEFGSALTSDTAIYRKWENAVQTWLFTDEETTTNGATISGFGGAIEIAASGSKLSNKAIIETVNGNTTSNILITSGSSKTVTVKATQNVQVTLYMSITNSGATAVTAGNITVAGATSGDGNIAVTAENPIVAVTFTLNAGTTASITQDASKYLAIYLIEMIVL